MASTWRNRFEKSRMIGLWLVVALVLANAGCSSRPCREYRRPDLAGASQQPEKPGAAPAPGTAGKEGAPMTGQPPKPPTPGQPSTPSQAKPSVPSTSMPTSPAATPTPSTTTVLVFKPDGSLQCNAAKGMSLEEMEKQLAGIKVVSRNKRPDGLMHIQVCGHPTGIINVYEIPAASLKEAETRGFKKLDRNL